MFLDASVLVAVLAGETEAEAIHSAIVESERLATSPLAVFEASSRIARLRKIRFDEAHDAAMDFLTSIQAEMRPVDTETGRLASLCATRYPISPATRHASTWATASPMPPPAALV
ncbi:type II toxin-antitoxin system VapC family toxin [Bosea sp. ANAM02]|uniref:PIN domain-containing protein n=1 Tax=Bosea sp. ANAM02 TaxID=2020412 RepID=UPI001565F9E2